MNRLDYNYHNGSIDYIGAICPSCAISAQFVQKAYHQKQIVNGVREHWLIAVCNSCQEVAFVHGLSNPDGANILQIFPYSKLSSQIEFVPNSVAENANETALCMRIGTWTAAVIMCRRTVQTSVYDLGAPGKNLFEQIDWLASNGKISPNLKDWAHEIRHFGNFGAHPDELFGDVTQQDAETTFEFLKVFLQNVYEMPARVNRSRERRSK